jgi:CheY-like chemotaxis protein
MALLLDDLLDVSRISRGRLELRLQPTALGDIVNAAVETSRPLLDRKHHRLSLEVPNEALKVSADPIRLSQVLSNLLSNAAKYTDERGEISVSAAREGEEVVIRVRDNGIGISPESQGHIFEMFSQLSPALERAEGGLGIGLALSKGLVDLHGGRIEVYSAGLGKGSEFAVHLPLLQPGGVGPSKPAVPAADAGGGRKVLIVDDNVDALESLAMLLEMQGYAVQMASSGLAALDIAERSPPDVAVLDIGMPGLNGYEVARRIRSEPWGAAMRLIALTGWGQAEDVQRARASGFDHHVTKPVDFDALQALVSG